VTPRFVIPQSLWLVEADPAQLGQVVSNLALNAAQAMGKRGTLLIMAENLEPGSEQGLARAVHISVTDTGAGIPPENLPKLFDPFFTTKSTGTGLGLAMVYSIIKRHGGRIHVDSTIGYGTTFHIYLPAAPSGAVAERVASSSPFLVPAGGKPVAARVLLMDDENEVRETVGLMLILLGYEVETASEGQEAIDLFEKARNSSRPFNAVILDLRVPDGLGGAETIKRLRAIDPKLKALVASGYCEDPTLADFRTAGFDATIAKPFNLDDLRTVVERLTSATF
jgi:CheY-like chemotaxis protein